MINLMPLEDRKQLAAARTNTLLLRYTVLLGIFIVVLVMEIIAMYVVMDIGKSQNETSIADNNNRAIEFSETKKQAADFKSNLATAKYILDKQVPYTDIILALAKSLPAGATISNFTIDPASFGTPTSMSVSTSSYDAAIKTKTSLQDAKMGEKLLFSDVSFSSVSGSGDANNSYTAVFDLTFSPEVLKP